MMSRLVIKLKVVSQYARETRKLQCGETYPVESSGISYKVNHPIFYIIKPPVGNLYLFYQTEVEVISSKS